MRVEATGAPIQQTSEHGARWHAFARDNGYPILAVMPGGNTCAFIAPMIFNYRLIVGNEWGVDDAWCYDTYDGALAALASWDPMEQTEPDGWKKHPRSGRYREGGDPAREINQHVG